MTITSIVNRVVLLLINITSIRPKHSLHIAPPVASAKFHPMVKRPVGYFWGVFSLSFVPIAQCFKPVRCLLKADWSMTAMYFQLIIISNDHKFIYRMQYTKFWLYSCLVRNRYLNETLPPTDDQTPNFTPVYKI